MLGVAGALTLVLTAAPLAAKPLPMDQINFGPQPELAKYREMAEAAVRDRLVDPDSAKFTWTYGLAKGGWKPLLQGWVYGYYSCGEVNSRNRMGGFAGRSPFVVIVNYDRVLYVEMEGPRSGDFVAEKCAQAAQQGILPLASAKADSNQGLPPSIKVPAYGFEFSDLPYGAYVAEIDEATKSSGLDSGMIITTFNGIKLQGLPLAVMGQIMNAATGPVTVSIMNSDTTIRLERAVTTGAPQ